MEPGTIKDMALKLDQGLGPKAAVTVADLSLSQFLLL
jgi:hypothetical protein